MTFEQFFQVAAIAAFGVVWKQLRDEVKALREWRHTQDGKLPALQQQVDDIDARVVRLENNAPKRGRPDAAEWG